MTMTPRGRLAAILCSAALVGVSACSKSSDNSNKGSASTTAPKTAPATPPTKVGATPATNEGAARPETKAAGGPRAETAEYVVELVAPSEVAAGKEAGFKVVVKPKGHWHFNLEFPTSVKAEATGGMTVAKPVQKLADATAKSEEGGAEWALAVTPSAAGQGTIKCDVKFAVCTETTCDPKKETIALQVEAK